jgi:poly(beta-D-mannuronate) lyase
MSIQRLSRNKGLRLLWPAMALSSLAALYGQSSQAADLVPPPGYFAAVGERKGDADSCPAVPTPYTGSLQFTSKYEGSDSARATLNVAAEGKFRAQIKDITDMERGTTKLITQYMRSGHKGDLDCALNWLTTWARADALESADFNHTGKSMRKWALGSLSSSYLRLKFSSSRPLAAYPQQAAQIEQWFGKLGTQVVTATGRPGR